MTTQAIGDRRLLRLADVLDKADAEHKRRGEPGYCQSRYRNTKLPDEELSPAACGTPACAWGHYIEIPSVRKRFRALGRTYPYSGIYFSVSDLAEFAIDRYEDEDIFGPSGCGGAQTAKQAAKYIRAFVKARQS
jgi:hypothetical protein